MYIHIFPFTRHALPKSYMEKRLIISLKNNEYENVFN